MGRELYDPFRSMQFDDDHCFLCGTALSVDNRTEEHVFPRWLQERYSLWNQRVTLLNGTSIPYRQLVVPCCSDCNMGTLASLERDISTAVERGFEAVEGLAELRIFQWISKIFYGLLFKEMFLRRDRRSKLGDTITSPDLLERYRTAHIFLQSLVVPMEFCDSQPWSLFRVKLDTPKSVYESFDYRDDIIALTYAMRMGDTGIIMCPQDNGAQQEIFADYFARFHGIPLTHLQFLELVAKVFYKARLLNRIPKYILISSDRPGEGVHAVCMPLQGFSSKPIYDDWVQRVYAEYLSAVWGVGFDTVFREPNLVLSLIESENGIIRLPQDQEPACAVEEGCPVTVERILEQLSTTRSPIDELDIPQAPGVYGVYLRSEASLPLEGVLPGSLIYIGRSDNLSKRQVRDHFCSEQSGWSTLRRSLGALLKNGLGLEARPRGNGMRDDDYRNYRFTDQGEEQLTLWMKANLEVGVCALPESDRTLNTIETKLVRCAVPVLNLTNGSNPWAKHIRKLRRECALEARRFQTQHDIGA